MFAIGGRLGCIEGGVDLLIVATVLLWVDVAVIIVGSGVYWSGY